LTLAGALVGATLAIAWPRTYVATSEVMLDPAALHSAGSSFGRTGEATAALIEAELRALRSSTMLTATVERLNLAADAEFNGNAAGPFAIGGALMNFGELVAGDGASMVEQRGRRAVEELASIVEARRVGGSSVIAVSARTGDPAKSALIANTISELFLEQRGGGLVTSAKVEQLRVDVAEAERAVATFRSQNDLLAADEIEELEAARLAAGARTAEFSSLLASVKQAGVDAVTTGSIPTAQGGMGLEDARARLTNLKQRVDTLATRLGPRHPDLLAAQAELDNARREAEEESQRVSKLLETELATVSREQQFLSARLQGAQAPDGASNEQMQKLAALEQAAETRRVAYEEAVRAAKSAGAKPGERIISQAQPPLQADGYGTPALSLAGALGGLLTGAGLFGWRRRSREEALDEQHSWHDDDQYHDAQWDSEQGYDPEAIPDAMEENDMYPYPHHAPSSAHGQGYGHPGPQAQVQPAPYQHPYPYQQPVPAMYPPQPHDPWAHARAYAVGPHIGAHYSPPLPYGAPYPPQPTVVYVPVPAMAPAPYPQHAGEAYHRDVIADRRTDAAIEEIRHSLRALREAIEDFADDRYGT
jgi:succinoglycan biosynthesis transport protein ExoP